MLKPNFSEVFSRMSSGVMGRGFLSVRTSCSSDAPGGQLGERVGARLVRPDRLGVLGADQVQRSLGPRHDVCGQTPVGDGGMDGAVIDAAGAGDLAERGQGQGPCAGCPLGGCCGGHGSHAIGVGAENTVERKPPWFNVSTCSFV